MSNLKHFMEVNAMLQAFVEMRRYYKEFEQVANSEPSAFVSEEQIYEARQLVEGGIYEFMGRINKMGMNKG